MKPEHPAVTNARNSGDVGVLIACVSIIVGVVFIGGLFTLISALYAASYGEADGVWDLFGTILLYGLLLGATLVIVLVTIRIMRQMNLGNMLQVEYSDYSWLREWSNQVAADLKMPQVEIFITQDPVMNAYAIGFMKPYNIVLNSGSVRYLNHEELKAVVVHEMGHIKYHHTQISAYVSILTSLPFVGPFATYILGFWSRRCELTADRLALFYLNDAELVKSALVKIHVGPDVAASFNATARKWQEHNTKGFFNAFSQTLGSHPFLVRRLQHIDKYLPTHRADATVASNESGPPNGLSSEQ